MSLPVIGAAVGEAGGSGWPRLVELLLPVGPWVLLITVVVYLAGAYGLVRMVLRKVLPARRDRDVTVTVRLLPVPRIEITVRAPQPDTVQTPGAGGRDADGGAED